jgi:hypothetical protein
MLDWCRVISRAGAAARAPSIRERRIVFDRSCAVSRASTPRGALWIDVGDSSGGSGAIHRVAIRVFWIDRCCVYLRVRGGEPTDRPTDRSRDAVLLYFITPPRSYACQRVKRRLPLASPIPCTHHTSVEHLFGIVLLIYPPIYIFSLMIYGWLYACSPLFFFSPLVNAVSLNNRVFYIHAIYKQEYYSPTVI